MIGVLYGDSSLIDLISSRSLTSNSPKVIPKSQIGEHNNMRNSNTQSIQPDTKYDRNSAARVVWIVDRNSWLALQRVVFEMEGATKHKAIFNKNPFVLHGLLSNNTESMIERHRDTSFGWYGFTLGTFGNSLKNLKVEIENPRTKVKGVIPKAYAEEFRALVADQLALGYKVPDSQTYAFLSVILSYHGYLTQGRAIDRSLSKEEIAYISQMKMVKNLSAEDHVEFLHLCHFYKFYNGAIIDKDKDGRKLYGKIKRLGASYSKYHRQFDLSASTFPIGDLAHDSWFQQEAQNG